MFALTGAQHALAAVDVVRRGFNLRLQHPAGIVVNRYRPRSAEHRYRLDELTSMYRDLALDPVLPERSAIAAAEGSCVPIQAWPSTGARQIARIFSSYLDQLLNAAGSDGPLTRVPDDDLKLAAQACTASGRRRHRRIGGGTAVLARRRRVAGKGAPPERAEREDKAEETVELTVNLPKRTRKPLRRKAETLAGQSRRRLLCAPRLGRRITPFCPQASRGEGQAGGAASGPCRRRKPVECTADRCSR
jgi:hypothetical protein